MTLRYRPFPFNLSESRMGIRREAGSRHRRSPGETRPEMLPVAGQKVSCSPVDRRKENGQVLFWQPDLPGQGEMLGSTRRT